MNIYIIFIPKNNPAQIQVQLLKQHTPKLVLWFSLQGGQFYISDTGYQKPSNLRSLNISFKHILVRTKVTSSIAGKLSMNFFPSPSLQVFSITKNECNYEGPCNPKCSKQQNSTHQCHEKMQVSIACPANNKLVISVPNARQTVALPNHPEYLS